MPVTVEPRENGRVLYSVYSDPWTITDMDKAHEFQISYYDTAPYKVHHLLNVTNARSIPPGIMRARTTSPEFSHPNSGYLAIFGAAPLLKMMADTLLKLARYKRAQFFSNIDDAWVYLRDVIAKES